MGCTCFTAGTGSVEKCLPLGDGPLFVGTVTEIIKLPWTEKPQFLRTRQVRLQVDEVFAGAKPGDMQVFTGEGNGDCGFPFEVGQQYLVSGDRDEQGRILVGICSGTVHVREAVAVLPQLRARRDKQKVASAYGVLSSYQRRFGGKYPLFDSEEASLPNVVVTAKRGEVVYEAVTNSEGTFTFYDLPAGTYSFDAKLPKGWEIGDYIGDSSRPEPVKLAAGACYEAALTVFPSGSIEGAIIDDSGKPQEYVNVTLVPADRPPQNFDGPWEGAGDGKFRFDHVAPGRYLLVANARNERGATDVYPRTFYPGVTNPDAAQPVVVTAGAQVRADIHLTRAVQSRKVHVTVLWQNGKPVDLADVRAKPQNDQPEDRNLTMTGKDGTAELPLVIGVPYVVTVEKICSGCWLEGGTTTCGSIAKVDGPATILPAEDTIAERTFVLQRSACPKERDGSFVRQQSREAEPPE